MNRIFYIFIFMLLAEASTVINAQQDQNSLQFRNTSLSVEERVNDLVSRMTLQEKADQLLYTAPAIPRLGVPEYNWWNEALHGVGRAGYATVFPQSVTIANSWDEGLMYSVASAISAEAAALAVKAGTDLECGVDYKQLMTAFSRGLITEADIDVAVKRVFQARFKLGMFDPDEMVPYSQIPAFENYDMKGKTYRFFSLEPLYPFGYGLSYTTFSYSDLVVPQNIVAGEKVKVSVTVSNTGKTEGDEVVQLYITDEKASTPRPIRQLEGFSRVTLKPGESRVVEFPLEPRQFSIINNKEKRVIEPGYYTIAVGGKQPGFKGYLDPQFTQVLTGRIRLTGKEVEFEN